MLENWNYENEVLTSLIVIQHKGTEEAMILEIDSLLFSLLIMFMK